MRRTSFLSISSVRARVTGRSERISSVIQSSWTLREAMTKKGRCSVFRQRPFDVSATTGCCGFFALGRRIFYRVFRKCGENRKPPCTPGFLPTKPQVAGAQNRGLDGRSRFYPALPKVPAGSMRQIPEPSSTPSFSCKETTGRNVVTI